MRWSKRAGLVAGLGFSVVWGGATLVALGTGDLTEPVVTISEEPFPPGTITSTPALSEVSCGDFEVDGPLLDAIRPHPDAVTCLVEAAEVGRHAVLVLRGRSDEGDPLRVQIRILGDASIELVVDDTRDQDGDGTVRRSLCTGFDPATSRPTGCEDAPIAG